MLYDCYGLDPEYLVCSEAVLLQGDWIMRTL